MKQSTKIILVVLGVLVVGALMAFNWYKSTYDELIRHDQNVKSAWSQVENQLQRRFDLIPNLVNTVKGYAAHESGVLIAVTEARSRVGSAKTVGDKMSANNEFSSAISRLLVVAENYPQLKANENFLSLQAQLEGTENRISVERRSYNEAVKMYNVAIRGFFKRFVATSLGYTERTFFEAAAGASAAPQVQF